MSPVNLSLVVPVYYEQDNILALFAAVSSNIKTPHELLVIYDLEDDPTADVVRQFAIANPTSNIRLIKNNVNGGRGVLNALKTGFNQAGGEAVLVVMADLSDDLSVADQMVSLHSRGASVVCASRYMRGGHHIGGPPLKRTLSRLAGLSLHYLRGVPTHDISNNYRLYDKNFLQSITIESQGGFEVAMEITVKAFRARKLISEVPATWRDRTAGQSNFKLWQWLPSYLKWYFHALV